MRIRSLLPSATEILASLGRRQHVAAVVLGQRAQGDPSRLAASASACPGAGGR
jgi:hypothetical protein